MLGSASSASISSSSGAIQPIRNGSTDSISGPPSLVVRTKPIPLGLGNPTKKRFGQDRVPIVVTLHRHCHLNIFVSALAPSANLATKQTPISPSPPRRASFGAFLMQFSRSGRTSTRSRNTVNYGRFSYSRCLGYVRIRGPKFETGRSRRLRRLQYLIRLLRPIFSVKQVLSYLR